MPNGSLGRLRWMDGLRGLAALAVVFQHLFLPYLSATKAMVNWFDPGVFGVGIFFCISGYVIPLSIKGCGASGAGEFLIARAFRLYPIYWVSLALACTFYSISPIDVLANAMMIQRAIGYQDAVGVYWTLQIELLFYGFVAAMLLCNLFNRRGAILVAGISATALSVMLGVIRFSLHKKAPIAVPIGLSFIFIGYAFYLVKADVLARKYFAIFVAAVYAMLIVACFLGYSQNWQYDENPLKFIVTYALAGAAFLYLSAHWRSPSRLAIWMGSISYPLYLFHRPIRDAAATFMHNNGIGIAIFSFALTVCIASLASTYIEKPFIRFGKAFVSSRAQQSALENSAP